MPPSGVIVNAGVFATAPGLVAVVTSTTIGSALISSLTCTATDNVAGVVLLCKSSAVITADTSRASVLSPPKTKTLLLTNLKPLLFCAMTGFCGFKPPPIVITPMVMSPVDICATRFAAPSKPMPNAGGSTKRTVTITVAVCA